MEAKTAKSILLEIRRLDKVAASQRDEFMNFPYHYTAEFMIKQNRAINKRFTELFDELEKLKLQQ